MPKVVDWAFEGLLGLMFIVTFLAQTGKDLYWWSWRRRITQQQQLHGTEMGNYPCPSRSGRSGKLGDEYRRDAYSAGPRNPPKVTSYIIRTAILATVFVGIAAYALTYLSSKSNAVRDAGRVSWVPVTLPWLMSLRLWDRKETAHV